MEILSVRLIFQFMVQRSLISTLAVPDGLNDDTMEFRSLILFY